MVEQKEIDKLKAARTLLDGVIDACETEHLRARDAASEFYGTQQGNTLRVCRRLLLEVQKTIWGKDW